MTESVNKISRHSPEFSSGDAFPPVDRVRMGGNTRKTNAEHYFVQSGESFLFLARSRSAGIAALFQATSDTAACDSNGFESRGREATWFPKGKPTSRDEKIRRDDERMFGIGFNQSRRPAISVSARTSSGESCASAASRSASTCAVLDTPTMGSVKKSGWFVR